MLPFYFFGSVKIYTANESGCVQITSLSSALRFASEEKKVVLGKRPWERISEGLFRYFFYVFICLVKTADCVVLGIVDYSDM